MRAETERTIREVIHALDLGDTSAALRAARSASRAADEAVRAELLLHLGPRAASEPNDH